MLLMLTVENISVFYGKVQALHNVDIAVNEGEIVALIGSNGAGKSTTLKTISGLLHPASGKIIYKGEDISNTSPEKIVILGIGHCPEERLIWPQMNVWENLDLGAYTRSDQEGIARDLAWVYELFPRLNERKDQIAGSLSGGEQQMLAISRTLMSNPQLIMFDEPSLGLAPILVDQIAEVIQEISRQGRTILLVEQNAFLALKMADRAYVLQSGSMFMHGGGQELLDNPQIRKAYLGR